MSELHLIKLSVGSESVDTLTAWQQTPRAQGADGLPRHVTRMWPKRAEQILRGGSIYWVIQGYVQCRQRILRFDEITDDEGKRHCAIVLDPKLIRTVQARKRPFQGWRYLEAADAPADLRETRAGDQALPPGLSSALADIGVL